MGTVNTIKKLVSVVIPTYNEEANVPIIYERVKNLFKTRLTSYDFDIIFIDNCSMDRTREIIDELSSRDPKVKYIFNVRNFGFSRSTFYGLTQADGDCAVLLFADMQDPPEMIEDFLREWETGSQIVVGIKNRSKENQMMYYIRKIYYNVVMRTASVEHISQFTGFGLYDSSFVKVLSRIDDPLPYLRGMVAELGGKIKKIDYTQEIRKNGKSSFKFGQLYDVAMLGMTSYTKTFMRLSVFGGIILAALCTIIGLLTLIFKLTGMINYPTGTAALIIGVFWLGAVQMFFIGILGEYVLHINQRVMHRPLVLEEKRKGFETEAHR